MKKYWGGNIYKFPDMDVVGTFVQIKLLDKAVPEPEQLTAMADTFRMPKPLFDIAPKAKKAGRSASLGGGKRQQLSAEDFPYFVPQAPDDMMVIEGALRPAKRPKGRPRKAKSLSTADDMYFHEEEAAAVASSSSASAAASAAAAAVASMMLPPLRPVRCPPEPDTESLYFFEEEDEQPATVAVQEDRSDDALDYFFEEEEAAASDTIPVHIASSSSSSSSSFATALSQSPQQHIAPDPATIATAPVPAPLATVATSAAALSTVSCQAPSSSSSGSVLRDLPSPMGLNSLFCGSPSLFSVPGDQSHAQTQGNQGATTHEDSSPLLSAGSVLQGFDEDLNEYDDDNDDDDLDDDLLTTTGYSIGSMLEIGPLQVFVPDC